MKLRTLSIAITTIIANVAFVPSTAAITVVGGKSCGEWIKYRHEGGWPKVIVQNWLMGYLSGVAMESGIDYLKEAEGESVYIWVDNYCNSNPLERTVNAADKLIIELRKRK